MKVRNTFLWMMVCAAVLQVHCQHWSYGLSPGGRRAVETLQETVEDLPKNGPSSYMCDYVGAPPHNKMSKLKELLAGIVDEEN